MRGEIESSIFGLIKYPQNSLHILYIVNKQYLKSVAFITQTYLWL